MATAPITVPPLQKGDRIEDWRHLFEASTQHMIAAEDGEQRAIQLLPAYVNRDIADREAVRDIVKSAEQSGRGTQQSSRGTRPPDGHVHSHAGSQPIILATWPRHRGILLPPETKGYLRQIRVETRRFLIGRTSTKRCPNEN